MNALERALAKFSHDAGVLDALTQLRHQQEVRVQWRRESGKTRIVKTYTGSLRPLQALEFGILSHPLLPERFRHLVRYDLATPLAGTEIVMRDCGLDLEDWAVLMRQAVVNPLASLPNLVAVWQGVLAALRKLHAAGFVHCDIKADNICIPAKDVAVDREGSITGCMDLSRLTLIDFGLALPPVQGIVPRSCYVEQGAIVVRPAGPSISRSYRDALAEAQRLYLASEPSRRGRPAWLELMNGIDGGVDIHGLAYMVESQLARFRSELQVTPADTDADLRKAHDFLAALKAESRSETPLRTDMPAGKSDPPAAALVFPFQIASPEAPRQSAARVTVATHKQRISGGPKMKYAIDGSNVLLGLRLDGAPSVRLFARLIAGLRQRGDELQLYFDNSTVHRMRDHDRLAEWHALQGALESEGIKPSFASRADVPIEEFCARTGAALINTTDKIDSWERKPKVIHRASVRQARGPILVGLRDNKGQFVTSLDASGAFTFGGMEFGALAPSSVVLDRKIYVEEHGQTGVPEAALIVFALDASGSMRSPDTWDGRSKADHLNEVMKSAFSRLRASNVGDLIYVAILRFSDDVKLMTCPGSDGAKFASADAWSRYAATFDYLQDVEPGLTNLRLAIQRSRELIHDIIFDSDLANDLADSWRAMIVLVTDGNHNIRRPDGRPEGDLNVIEEIEDIDTGSEKLIDGKIAVGCVGIGSDLNMNLLSKIASPCTTDQLDNAAKMGVAKYLENGCLLLKVDERKPNFGTVIRSFVDMMSGST
ncbi:MAG: VWA domain-containing protein [Proteobacteria bacterium]|nr:VWA domain-containing protein [Pseudomonadota bacterium]